MTCSMNRSDATVGRRWIMHARRIKIRRWHTKPVKTGCRSALQPASAGFCVSAAGFIPRDIPRDIPRAIIPPAIPRAIIPPARIKIRRWHTKPVKTGCRSARPPLQPASAGFCVSAAGFIPRAIIPRHITPPRGLKSAAGTQNPLKRVAGALFNRLQPGFASQQRDLSRATSTRATSTRATSTRATSTRATSTRATSTRATSTRAPSSRATTRASSHPPSSRPDARATPPTAHRPPTTGY